jgi:hypothetical protein
VIQGISLDIYFFEEDSMKKRSHVVGSIQAKVCWPLACTVLMISILVLLGCPTGGGADSDSTDVEDLPSMPGGGGGGGSGNGGSTPSDSPNAGTMTLATGLKIFDLSFNGGVTIDGVKDADALGSYLNGGINASIAAARQYGAPLLALTGGNRTLILKSINGNPVIGIKDKAFSPGSGGSYESKKDITRVVGKIQLPDTLTDIGTSLFVGVANPISVDVPAKVVELAKTTTNETTEQAALQEIIGATADKVTVIKEGNSSSPVIDGPPALEKVEKGALSGSEGAKTGTVSFTFNKAVTVDASPGVSGAASAAGTPSTGTGSTVVTVTLTGISGDVVRITFTATASGKTTEVDETVVFASGSTTESTVALSTKAGVTTSGLTVASKTKTGDTHLITLTGTAPLTVPSALVNDYGTAFASSFAVITFTGIKDPAKEIRIQQTSPGLEGYLGSSANPSGPNYGTTPKTQAGIETAYSTAPGNTYFWQTANPVTCNKLKKYDADGDADFSVIIAPGATAADQIATVVTKVTTGTSDAASSTTTTYVIDYTAVSFDVKDRVKVSGNAVSGSPYAWTTSGLSVASATQQGSDVYISLAGSNVPLTMDDAFKGAMFSGVTNVAVITLDGMWADQETALIHQVNPALEQYVIEGLDTSNTVNYTTTAKTLAEVEAAFTATPKRYFWQTASPVTYNKLSRGQGDGVTSILLKPATSADNQQITITKKTGGSDTSGPLPADFTRKTTYHLDYTKVSFASGS